LKNHITNVTHIAGLTNGLKKDYPWPKKKEERLSCN